MVSVSAMAEVKKRSDVIKVNGRFIVSFSLLRRLCGGRREGNEDIVFFLNR